ncbi:hypothetical protein [Maribacter polysaccharolyticus]|uniref:hypothetical protein n=1 Tax=Maribacter polysaccharolyticus TaxID=3020831 RepID=UPI00237F1BA9|nr:hypothetical protein [Maribacter polysaccharolyticus]MDE3742598.1 hypothetical protein [Maribacter polysaccharolyticus]
MSRRIFHEHESDSRIMLKKDRKEMEGWTESLDFIGEELNYLIAIENPLLNDRTLYRTT